jgi:hypothetical protein
MTMGRHSKDRSGPTATDKALLVAGASLVILVVVVSVVVAIMFGASDGDGTDTAEPQQQRTPPAASSPATAASTSPAPTQAAPTPPPQPSAPAATRRATRPPTLAFQVVGAEAWIRVTSGDEILVSGTFTEGQRRAFDEPELTVRLGNAGNVRLVVNGQPRPLGEPGQIEELTVRRG